MRTGSPVSGARGGMSSVESTGDGAALSTPELAASAPDTRPARTKIAHGDVAGSGRRGMIRIDHEAFGLDRQRRCREVRCYRSRGEWKSHDFMDEDRAVYV